MIDLIKFVANCIIATLLLVVRYQVQLLSVPFVFHSDFQNQTMRIQKFSKARCNVGTSADKEQELNTWSTKAGLPPLR